MSYELVQISMTKYRRGYTFSFDGMELNPYYANQWDWIVPVDDNVSLEKLVAETSSPLTFIVKNDFYRVEFEPLYEGVNAARYSNSLKVTGGMIQMKAESGGGAEEFTGLLNKLKNEAEKMLKLDEYKFEHNKIGSTAAEIAMPHGITIAAADLHLQDEPEMYEVVFIGLFNYWFEFGGEKLGGVEQGHGVEFIRRISPGEIAELFERSNLCWPRQE